MRINRLALAGLFLLIGVPAWAAPLRVMSLNACTDSLVLDLLPPARITSVSWLARDPAASVRWREAGAVPLNHGTAEEVLTQRPDLVLAGSYTTQSTRALLARLHIRMLIVPPATDFAAIRTQTRAVADAVGVHDRGTALIARMDATLAALAHDPPHQAPRVLAWDGAGDTAGPGTLFHAILTVAGGNDLARGGSSVGLEQVIWLHPDVLAHGDSDTTAPGLRAAALTHPLIRRLYGRRTISYPEALYDCGVPGSADAALALRAALAAVTAAAPADPPPQANPPFPG